MQATTDHGTQFSKWLELRAKTDRQLAVLLSRTLGDGVRSALEAAETGAPQLLERAARACQEAERLLPYVRREEPARRRIERELARLRRLLEERQMAPAHAGAV